MSRRRVFHRAEVIEDQCLVGVRVLRDNPRRYPRETHFPDRVERGGYETVGLRSAGGFSLPGRRGQEDPHGTTG